MKTLIKFKNKIKKILIIIISYIDYYIFNLKILEYFLKIKIKRNNKKSYNFKKQIKRTRKTDKYKK